MLASAASAAVALAEVPSPLGSVCNAPGTCSARVRRSASAPDISGTPREAGLSFSSPATSRLAGIIDGGLEGYVGAPDRIHCMLLPGTTRTDGPVGGADGPVGAIGALGGGGGGGGRSIGGPNICALDAAGAVGGGLTALGPVGIDVPLGDVSSEGIPLGPKGITLALAGEISLRGPSGGILP